MATLIVLFIVGLTVAIVYLLVKRGGFAIPRLSASRSSLRMVGITTAMLLGFGVIVWFWDDIQSYYEYMLQKSTIGKVAALGTICLVILYIKGLYDEVFNRKDN